MKVTRPSSVPQTSAFPEVQHLHSTFKHCIPALCSSLAQTPVAWQCRAGEMVKWEKQPSGQVLQERNKSAHILLCQGGNCHPDSLAHSNTPEASQVSVQLVPGPTLTPPTHTYTLPWSADVAQDISSSSLHV